MRQFLSKKLRPLLPYLSLPIILLVAFALWVNLPEEHFSSVYSRSGTWDLREFNFEAATAALHGRAETIPGSFLTPEEFAAREHESVLAYPRIPNTPGTVRVRLLLPTDDYYTITRISTGYADRIYVNGAWLRDVGNPEDDAEDILFSPVFTFAARPENGVIEILHRQSNFIYHVHGIYQYGALDEYTIGNAIRRVDHTTDIILGILLALAIVSLLMFLLLHNYRPALLFSLLCLAWFLCIGAMGTRAFLSLAPWHIDPLRVRLAIIISPVTSVFMAAIVHDMFPGILHKYFVRAVVVLFSGFTAFFLIADVGIILSHVLWISMSLSAIGTAYAIAMLIRHLRKPDVYQSIFIVGTVIFGYSALRDLFSYLYLSVEGFFLMIPPFSGANFTRVGVIVFLLCQAATIFIATMRKMTEAQAAEQRLAVENATLERLSRMKTKYLANISHETKTPLTVISVNVQLAADLYQEAGEDGKLIRDALRRAQEEILRVARTTESHLRLASMQESHEKMAAIDIAKLLANSAEVRRYVLAKQGNTLTISIPEQLPCVYGNADYLIQVVDNLFANANTHTKDGAITIEAVADSKHITTTITDSGTGIAPAILPRVFERGVTGTDGGTGIGLALCKHIIESQGGAIWIESEPGEGTAVTFTLPVHTGEEDDNA